VKPLVLIALFALTVAASPILVGPIGLDGVGILTNPDCSQHGAECLGGLGLVFSASGPNGTDTVSIRVDSVAMTLFNSPHYLQDLNLQALVFDASSSMCGTYDSPGHPRYYCDVSIDGISGFGAFSNIGGDIGTLQVFDKPYDGNLLAQAQIMNTHIEVTSVVYRPGFPQCPTCPSFEGHFPGTGQFLATFAIVDAPADIPEPSSLILLSGGLLLLFRARSVL